LSRKKVDNKRWEIMELSYREGIKDFWSQGRDNHPKKTQGGGLFLLLLLAYFLVGQWLRVECAEGFNLKRCEEEELEVWGGWL